LQVIKGGREHAERVGTTFDDTKNVVPIRYRFYQSFNKRCLVKPCDQNIKLTIELTREMIRLADQGDADREDTGCGVLYGVLRDAAFKIRQLAEQEKGKHQAKGWWQEECPPSARIKGTDPLKNKKTG
jgi:hypothetical protein